MKNGIIPAGQVVHVGGIPVRLNRPAKVSSDERNWPMILDHLIGAEARTSETPLPPKVKKCECGENLTGHEAE